MPNCISCGRELPSPDEPHNICPECRAAIMAHTQSSAPLRTRRAVALERMPLTSVLIGVNVLVFLAMAFSGVSLADPSIADLVKWGANNGLVTLLIQPWRMWTSNYVHIGLLHIALNMWCLWNLGALAERVFDRWTYFLTYTLCGLAGSLVSIGLHPTRVGAGASGAIFGLAGALISALYLGHLPVHPSALKATLKSLLSFAGYNLFFGAVVPAIDNSAHIGGLVTGLAVGAVLAPHLTSPPEERAAWNRWVFILAGALFLLAFYFVRRLVPQLVFHH
jgi:membrane associated rhomboid family serine protease